MGIDVIGRALATRALSRTASLDLFTNLPAQTIDPTVMSITTGGYSAVGSGGATYVADSLATAALAAAHPRACKASANGRYFRLAGPVITVEQLGALGCANAAANTPNDQPAFQAALDYAAAVGIRTVQMTRSFYALWTSTRTHSDLNYANDGRLITIKHGVTLEGVGPRPVLTRWGNTGQTPSDLLASIQVIGGNYWRGGGIWLSPDSDFSAATVTLRNFKLDGQLNRNAADHSPVYPPGTLTGWDITDKGFSTGGAGANTASPGLSMVQGFDIEICRFRGELNHGATINGAYFQDCHWHTTGGDANNWQGGYARFDSCKFGNAYSSSEDYCFSGRQMNNCEIYDCDQGGFSGGPDPTWDPANFNYARRQDGYAPWVYLNDLMIRNCPTFYIGSWVRGRIVATDCTINCQWSGNISDVDLEIESWVDQTLGNSRIGFIVDGPPTLTTQMSGKPAGTYFDRPRNINVRLQAKQTKRAKDNGIKLAALFGFSGYLDADTCHLVAGPSVVTNQAANTGGAQPTVPYIRHDKIEGNVRGVNGTDDIAADTTVTPARADMNLNPTGTGPYVISLGTTVEYAHEQELTFWFSEFATEDRRLRFLASAANLKLPHNLVLSRRGEFVRLRYNRFIGGSGTWTLVDSNVHRLVGSATYDAPNVASGAQTTTTVTVTGAQLGDKVETITLGLSAGGLVVTGYVSAADTVTVVLTNLSGAAVNLASTTLTVEVGKR